MDLPTGYKPFNVVEIRFKGSRKEFFRNTNNLELYTGDYVCVESSIGFDIGTVSATGEIVRLQLKKYRVREDSEEMRGIQRVASEKDLERRTEAKSKEDQTLERARTIAFSLNLQMKISDIEIQGDGRKAIFFYTAESRVDFRELIKRYADEFKVKIEMRHISYREEASRLGGTGVCGRELCCSTWLTDYKQVNTGAARVQNLSINMEKLAGQCGRLKCCLNYELDQYVEAIDAFPKDKVVKLDTVMGMAYARKTDILKKLMWFSYDDNQTWVALPVATVNEVMEDNRNGKQAAALQDLAPASAILDKVNGNGQDQNNDFIGNNELLQDDEFALRKRAPEKREGRGPNDRRKGGNDLTKRVVNDVSVEVNQGEIVGLLGPNGAGKTTSFYMFVGLVRPDEGKVFLEDTEISTWPMFKRAQNGVGYLPQEASVFRELSVEENIQAILEMTSLSKAEQADKLESLIAEFGLGRVRKNLGKVLSGGERRRTEIARALATDPKFILLDEPFAGVDPIAVEDIQQIVAKLKQKNIGILITDHNVQETLSITDRAYLLFEGKLLKHGTAEELASDEMVRKVYLGQNFELRRSKSAT